MLLIDEMREAENTGSRTETVISHRRRTAGFAALIFFVVATIVMTWPLAIHLGDAADPYDDLLHAWTLAWDWHAITTGVPLFDANIFFPLKSTLAYSDHLLGLLPVAGPIISITGNPVLALNVCTMLAMALTGWFVFMWLREETGSEAAGLVAGFAMVFRPSFVEEIHQLQILSFFGVIASFRHLGRFMKDGKVFDIVCFFIGALFTLFVSWYLTAIFALCGAIWFAARLYTMRNENHAPYRRVFVGVACAAIVIGMIAWPLAKPYRALQDSGELTRSGRDVRLGSVDVTRDFLNVSETNLTWGAVFKRLDRPASYWFFPGIVFPVLSLMGIVAVMRRKRGDPVRGAAIAIGVMAAVGFVLAMGPTFLFLGSETSIPLPGRIVQSLPGFSDMRLLHRYLLTGTIAMGFFGAFAVARITRDLSAKNRVLATCAIVACLAAEAWAAPIKYFFAAPQDRMPEVHRWIRDSGLKGAILEYPTGPGLDSSTAAPRAYSEYFSTIHWNPVVVGYSGHIPNNYYEIMKRFKTFPASDAIEYLKKTGIRIVIIHADGNTWSLRLDPTNFLYRDPNYILEEQTDDYIRYRFADAPEGISIEMNVQLMADEYSAVTWPGIYRKRLEATRINRLTVWKKVFPYNLVRLKLPEKSPSGAPVPSKLIEELTAYATGNTLTIGNDDLNYLTVAYGFNAIFDALMTMKIGRLDFNWVDAELIRRATGEPLPPGVKLVKQIGSDYVFVIE